MSATIFSFIQFKDPRRRQLKNQQANKKAYRLSLPPLLRLTHVLKANRFKLLFAGAFSGLLVFYDWHSWFGEKLRTLSGWGRKQLGLSQPILRDEQQGLQRLYSEVEGMRRYGLSRGVFSLYLRRKGAIKSDEEQTQFLKRSGYFKPNNQKLAAVPFQEFRTQLLKINEGRPLEGFYLRQLRDDLKALMTEQAETISSMEQKREFMICSLPLFEGKLAPIIQELLQLDPTVSVAQLRQRLNEQGVKFISLKSLIETVRKQVKLAKLLVAIEQRRRLSFLHIADCGPQQFLQRVEQEQKLLLAEYRMAFDKDYNPEDL